MSRRRRLLIVGGALTLAVAAGVTASVLHQSSSQPAPPRPDVAVVDATGVVPTAPGPAARCSRAEDGRVVLGPLHRPHVAHDPVTTRPTPPTAQICPAGHSGGAE